MQLNISGHSTALFSTWFFIEELGLLFDAGDGLNAALGQKSGKIRHVFISHADRDHLSGLLQFNQINAKNAYPSIHYPKDCGSFKALQNFSSQFDPQSGNMQWVGIENGSEIFINKQIKVVAFRNTHVDCPTDIHKSLSFKVVEVKRKLKPQYQERKGKEIKLLKEQLGQDAITDTIENTLFAYSGDTPVLGAEVWSKVPTLIHEATFLRKSENIHAHGNAHSTLEEVIEMAATLPLQKLVLTHFSSRYSAKVIDATIQELCKSNSISFPVYRILPGKTVFNILETPPVYVP